MDESSWNLLNGRIRTVANVGQDGVRIAFPYDTKAHITIIATISAAGDKLPIMVLAKGRTEICERTLKEEMAAEIRSREIVPAHSEQGWVDSDLAIQYLDFLREWADGNGLRNIVLLWDVYASHRAEAVKLHAASKHIRLIYVPAGGTSEYQPLDRHVFGDVKSRALARLGDEYIRDEDADVSLLATIHFLAEAWRSIQEDQITSAWRELTPKSVQTLP
jgi:hypothetical protein